MKIKAATKQKIKKAVAYVLAALALVGTMALVGNLSDGFKNLNPKDWDVNMRNENNLISLDVLEGEYATSVGLTVEQKNGILTLSGENKSATDATVDIATFTLSAGKYMFSTGKDGRNTKTSAYSYYMKLVDAKGNSIADADGKASIEVSADTEVKLQLVVAAKENVDGVKLYPAIVEGEEHVSYYGNSDKD